MAVRLRKLLTYFDDTFRREEHSPRTSRLDFGSNPDLNLDLGFLNLDQYPDPEVFTAQRG